MLVLESTLALLLIITRLLLVMLGVLVRFRRTRRGGTGIVYGLCVRVVVVAGDLMVVTIRAVLISIRELIDVVRTRRVVWVLLRTCDDLPPSL